MKKIFLFLLMCIGSISYAQQKIGNISDKNILEITYINNSLIYSYVEESTGLISIKKQYFCNINGKVYGPFTKQPEIKNLKSGYCIETLSSETSGCIIDNIYYENFVSEIVFNEDKTSYAFIYRLNGKDNLILNGKTIVTENKIYDVNFLTDLMLCYTIEEETEDDTYYYIRIGDKSYGPYEDVSNFYFSKSRKHYYLSVTKNNEDFYFFDGTLHTDTELEKYYNENDFVGIKTEKDKVFYSDGNTNSIFFDSIDRKSITKYNNTDIFTFVGTIDDQEYLVKSVTNLYGPFPKDTLYSVYCEPNSGKIYYNLKYGDQYYFYEEGNFITSSYLSIYPQFSEKGNIYCFVKQDNNKMYYLQVNDECIGPFENIYDIGISKDESKVVYGVKIDGKNYAVDGIKKYGPYKKVNNICISPDNSIAFDYMDEEYNAYFYYKGNHYGPYAFVNDFLTTFSFSSDGARIACNVKLYGEKGISLCVDGKTYGAVTTKYVSFSDFSPDNRNIIMIGYDTADKNQIVYNDTVIEGKSLGTISFTTSGVVAYSRNVNDSIYYCLLIEGKEYIGRWLENGYIYIKNNEVYYKKF